MKPSTYRERLRALDEQAQERQARARAEHPGKAHRPQPGDVYAVAETAGLGVLWAILEHHASDPRRLLAVAADLDPSIGSTDVEVPADATCGALTLRCGCHAWIDARFLIRTQRTGSFGSEILERARGKRSEIAADNVTATAAQQDTESEPDYRRWTDEVLTEAQAAVTAPADPQPADISGHVVDPHPQSLPKGGRWSLAHMTGLAASILLAVSLGFGSGWLWQQTKISRLEHRLQNPDAMVDLPFIWLYPVEAGRTNDRILDSEMLTISLDTDLVMLILGVSEPTAESGYRVEIRDHTDAVVWSHRDLELLGINELSIALPRRLIPPGDYRLDLYGQNSDSPAVIAEYRLRVKND